MPALTIPPEIETRLDALARRTGRTTTSHALEAILEHIEDLEDAEMAERRLQDLQEGRSETVLLADLMARHGLAD
ncbi:MULTISPECIES: hypothetical protein [unclassified Aureimonas]|uniref:type II toxin-antitoxin system RelB family antitoxin n=1 Tax=unclassified Aureimonas TaxID=2615206 RepID=UPI0006F84EB5|nr:MULTISPECIES: hypothetical protein [unclassified Aureimonas]KQT64307.1 CopG family transcriptional regulator [Aureimonas sp. Leaf427]KQT81496.1 CopG family transcriptional regulator [Aureimonas sp. Leaf460]